MIYCRFERRGDTSKLPGVHGGRGGNSGRDPELADLRPRSEPHLPGQAYKGGRRHDREGMTVQTVYTLCLGQLSNLVG